MADIIHLPIGERPPEPEDWLCVETAAEGKFLISTCLGNARNPGMMGPFPSFDEAMESAQDKAKRWGLTVIYVRGASTHA